MIEIKAYENLNFYKWLIKNITEKPLNSEEIVDEQLIEKFIFDNYERWDFRFFLKLFQDYGRNSKNVEEVYSIIEDFENFFKNSNSLKYVNPDSLSKAPYIKSYLNDFYNYTIRNININEPLIDLAFKSHDQDKGLEWWFEQIYLIFGDLIVDLFRKFNESSFNYDSYEQFINWKSERKVEMTFNEMKNRKSSFSSIIRIENIYNTLNSKSDIESMQLLTHNADMIHNGTMIGNGILSKEDFSYLDFLNFLSKEKGINLSKNLTLTILLSYIEEYCDIYGDSSRKKLIKFVRSLNKRDSVFLSTLKKFDKTQSFDLNRINIPTLHGILLFPENKNFKFFLEKNWKDLHHMTGNVMDIYYTKYDFIRNKSCYEKVKDIPLLKVENTKYPAIILWNKFGGKVYSIELVGLTHQEIFDVIQFIVTTIGKNSDFENCIDATRQEVIRVLENKRGIIVNNNISNSQIGVVGDNTKSYGTVFTSE